MCILQLVRAIIAIKAITCCQFEIKCFFEMKFCIRTWLICNVSHKNVYAKQEQDGKEYVAETP